MKSLCAALSLIAVLAVVGCGAKTPPVGSPTAVGVPVVFLQYAIDGVNAGAASGWLSPLDASLADDLLGAALTAAQDKTVTPAQVRQTLVDFESRMTNDSKIRPYLDWLIAALGDGVTIILSWT